MSITPFSNGEFDLPLIVDGDTFKVLAPQLAKALGMRDAARLMESIPENEKGYTLASTPGGPQRVGYLTEAGFYRALGQRQAARIADEAIRAQVERFQAWVYSDLLPTFRKHGAYMSPAVIEQTLTDPDFIIRLATDLKAERARNAELAAESERRRARLTLVVPKADAFDLWLSTNINFAVGTVAKALCAAGADSGRTKLFDYMAELGWIFKSGRQWEPYQSQINNGRLAVKLGSQLNTRTGEQFQTVTVRITPKGATALATRYGVMPETVADLLAADPEAGAA